MQNHKKCTLGITYYMNCWSYNLYSSDTGEKMGV